MKKLLIKKNKSIYYFKEGGVMVDGSPDFITGDLTGITGNLSGITGDLNDCGITDEDRKKGILVEDLIKD